METAFVEVHLSSNTSSTSGIPYSIRAMSGINPKTLNKLVEKHKSVFWKPSEIPSPGCSHANAGAHLDRSYMGFLKPFLSCA